MRFNSWDFREASMTSEIETGLAKGLQRTQLADDALDRRDLEIHPASTAGDLAYEGARRVLDEHERMLLVGVDRDAFLAAVMEPPEKLVAALKRRREMTR
jgi:hypothetical protein